MTMVVWGEPVRKGRALKRYKVYAYIIRYAKEHNGVTPSFLHLARHFDRSYSTVRGHIYELIAERLLRIEDRQIIVEDSEWIPPPYGEEE